MSIVRNLPGQGLKDEGEARAPATKGVTNGDSHDHDGGDGATVPIAGGGTGATTAAAARTALGIGPLIIRALGSNAPQTGSFDERYLFDGSANHLDGRVASLDLTRTGAGGAVTVGGISGESILDNSTYLKRPTVGASALHNLGACTVQTLVTLYEMNPPDAGASFWEIGGATDSEADNVQSTVRYITGSALKLSSFWEYGAGTNDSFTSPWPPPFFQAVLITETTSADVGGNQTHNLYVNELLAGTYVGTTKTGSTNAQITLGNMAVYNQGCGPACIHEWRQIGAEYSAANVAADYAIAIGT